VNRCDPQGLFIRRWLPELAALTNDQLGSPPPLASYPAPILDYDQARRLRLDTLSAQRLRSTSLQQNLARLPERFTPFGAERIAGASIGWSEQPQQELQPLAVAIDSLDAQGWTALMSWFSGSSRTTGSRAGAASASRKGSSSRRRSAKPAPGQLSLDLGSL
jgi:deoxyribodipyrimidine photo-lyase